MIQMKTATTRLTCAYSIAAIASKAAGMTSPSATPAAMPSATQTVRKRSNTPMFSTPCHRAVPRQSSKQLLLDGSLRQSSSSL